MTETTPKKLPFNKNDPLTTQGPDHTRELFKQFSLLANGFSHDNVLGAAGNMLINVVRQKSSSGREAEKAFDELFYRLKTALMDHYDGVGKRKNIFPFDQTIEIPFLNFKKK